MAGSPDEPANNSGRPIEISWPSTQPRAPRPGSASNRSTGGNRPGPRRAAMVDSSGHQVLGRLLQCSGPPKHAGAVEPGCALDVGDDHCAGGHRSRLVEQHRVDLARGLERLVALEEDPMEGALRQRPPSAPPAWPVRAHTGRR